MNLGRASEPKTDTAQLEPEVLQWKASQPSRHVWVGASAGTGKTKVLTDRVLRLLLPQPDGQPGTDAHRILCLTYTKAAAAEMRLRINKKLGEWAVKEEEDLQAALRQTCGVLPTAEMMKAARRLFAHVVDTPGGLKIMTIHAFCQSVLGRFPLEAGISPHMRVMEASETQDLLSELIHHAARKADPVDSPFARLMAELPQSTLFELIRNLVSEGSSLARFFNDYPQELEQIQALREVYDAPGMSSEKLDQEFCANVSALPLKRLGNALLQGEKTDQERAHLILQWLFHESPQEHTAILLQGLLTQKKEPFAKFTKATLKADPQAWEIYQAIVAEGMVYLSAKKAVLQVEKTHDLLTFGFDVYGTYAAEKERRAVLDYHDLLSKTLALLKRAENAVPWVMFKLDGGLDHILVDEAQDTNPLQWEIIAELSEYLFRESSPRGCQRTLFVVGDEKQSIYRFQGANLQHFQYMKDHLSSRAGLYGPSLDTVPMNISFRSTASVLRFVDAAFKEPEDKLAIGLEEKEILRHKAFRRRDAGEVMLWPLTETVRAEPREPWQPPIAVREERCATGALAERIAKTIRHWIDREEILPSKGRPIRPGDVMVLVRSRNAFVNALVRALKQYSIPVSGADRLKVTRHIAVKDLLSAAKFALQPGDDLSLAELLKSPLVGLDEQALFDVAYGRDKISLWHALQHKGQSKTVAWLQQLIASKALPPHLFFVYLLQYPCPADEVSGWRAMRGRLGQDCLDPLEEFLQATQDFDRNEIPSLQKILVWLQSNPLEIRREMEEDSEKGPGQVRIMTVHGAKGLQAPIVFLPDSLRDASAVGRYMPRLIFPERSGEAVPLWSPRAEDDSPSYRKIYDRILTQEHAEYKRLFYVATTRAEDRLIICGAKGERTAHAESWYHYAQKAFAALPEDVEEQVAPFDAEQLVQILHNPQTEPATLPGAPVSTTGESTIPDWAYRPAPEEPDPPRPLMPSRPSEENPPVSSPLAANQNEDRFRRGNLSHALLQFLPGLPQEQWKMAAGQYMAYQAADLPEHVQRDICREVLAVMQDPHFVQLFGTNSQAEVPVTGRLPSGRVISGQIDRLVVGGDEVWIIDYKTNRPPPTSKADIPLQYQRQLRAYAQALRQIYPDKSVRCALLWTESCHLMEVEL